MRSLCLACVLLLILTTQSAASLTGAESELVLHKDEVSDIVYNTIEVLEHTYLFPHNADVARQWLNHKQQAGEFDRSFKFGRLKQLIESSLIAKTGDSGFEVIITPSSNTVQLDSTQRQQHAIKTLVLEPHIGYMEMRGDFNSSYPELAQQVDEAFTHLGDIDSLIIDLRHAGEGNFALAQHVVSYFFPPKTVLSQAYFNPQTPEHTLLSLPLSPPAKVFDQQMSVFILTSSFVAGPWEFIAYTLKHFERAQIIGEDTIGVSHLKKVVKLSKNVSLVVPFAKTKHPVTEENWQRWGVIADEQISAEKSFDRTLELLQQPKR